MTRKDFQLLADAMGEAFFLAGAENRTLIYDSVYTPLVRRLNAENERFDLLRFSHACAVAEGNFLGFNNPPAYDSAQRS